MSWRVYQVESYFSDIGGTLGLYLGMSLMSVVEFFELALDLAIYAVIQCRLKRQLAAREAAGGPPGGQGPGERMPWEPPAPGHGGQFSYMQREPPPSYRAATRMSRAFPNDIRDVMLNM